jgi:HlyD family secretion protein
MAATVSAISPEVDAQRGAVEVKFRLDRAPPAFLREDMTLSVEVETARRARALVLPARALRGGADGETVLVSESGRVRERPVRTGVRTLDAVEVLSGVAEGEEVLLGAALRAGQRVRTQVVQWQPSRTATARAGRPDDPMSGLTQAVGR